MIQILIKYSFFFFKMFKVPLEELKEKIRRGALLTREEVELRIKDKINELSGLISEEGAAHIIANELGVKMLEEEGRLKVKNIYVGMRQVEVLGKVVNKFEVREFEREGQKRKVGNLIIGDETGTIRVVCWGEQAELLGKIKEGDVILIKWGWAKENNFNQKELHLNEKSKVVVNPEGETMGEVKQGLSYERKKIAELKEGDNGVEIFGTVVQIFELRFFKICPECGKRVVEKEDGFYCGEHEKVTPGESYVLNLVLDDGTETIRGVFWRNQTNNLLKRTEEEISKFRDNPGLFEEIKTELLGEQFKVVGRVNHNEMFERKEFNVQLVFKGEIEEEVKRLEREKAIQ